MSAAIMDSLHPRWNEFVDRLNGPEGLNWQPDPEDPGNDMWTRDGTPARPLARAILVDMGLTDTEISATFAWFDQHGGGCDCEIVWNVVSKVDDAAITAR